MSVPAASYNPNIPQSTDLLSNSQLSLLNNFGALQTLVDVDHVDFANAAAGQHNKVTFLNQAGLPVFSPLGVIGMYSAADATSGQNELYINKTNNSGVVQVAATESILGTSNPVPGTFGNTGWTMLPSGIKLAWGTFAGSGAGVQTVTIGSPQAFATTILSVQLTIAGSGVTAASGQARLQSYPAANQFAVCVTDFAGNFSTLSVIYLAIGY